MPRRSGTTTVWSFASSAAIGDHMSPVSPKPWISTTAGPWPPTRTLIVASALTTCELRKSAGKGVGAACADRAPSARLAARPPATRGGERLRRGVFTTVSELVKAIDEYVAHHNKEPKPFIWIKSARDILQKVIRASSRLSSKQSATRH